MTNVKAKRTPPKRISQGDIFREIEYVEYFTERRGIIEAAKIVFPLVAVLTQDCDLEQDARYRARDQVPPQTDDKKLISVLVVPLYNAEQVFLGDHLERLNMRMAPLPRSGTSGKTLMQNERPRYHYLDFPRQVPIAPAVADFKHYFSINVGYLERIRRKHFVCSLSELYRESLSQRFANYLARIGLPEINIDPVKESTIGPAS